jgi:hypothetical protein
VRLVSTRETTRLTAGLIPIPVPRADDTYRHLGCQYMLKLQA